MHYKCALCDNTAQNWDRRFQKILNSKVFWLTTSLMSRALPYKYFWQNLAFCFIFKWKEIFFTYTSWFIPGLWSRSQNFLNGGIGAWKLSSGSTEMVCGASALYKWYRLFLLFWTKLFWSQKLLDVGAGAEIFRCPELEPEILVPAPQPWFIRVIRSSQ